MGYALKLPLFIYHAKTTISVINQYMGCTYIYLETDTILFHFQIVCLIFYCLFFIQNKVKVFIPLTFRENVISVCWCVFFKVKLNKHYVLQHQFFQPAIHALGLSTVEKYRNSPLRFITTILPHFTSETKMSWFIFSVM